MTGTAIQTPLDQLAGAWQRVLAQSEQASPFILPQWQACWWRQWGAGSEAVVLKVEKASSIIGLAPLRLRGNICSLVGSSDLCDYLDFVVERGLAAPFFEGLLPQLDALPWDVLELTPARADSLILTHFKPRAEARGWRVEIAEDEVAPWLALPSDWESYLGMLTRKDRHELRRKMRRLLEQPGVALSVVTDPRDAGERIDRFFALMGESRADKAEFLTPERTCFFKDVVESMGAAGLLRLWFLEYQEQTAATALCFDVQGTRYLYNSGFDRSLRELSVGLVLKALTIKDAIERGLQRFDFLRGNEPYKYDLGGKDIPIYRCVITR